MAGLREPEYETYAYLRHLSRDKLLELLTVAPIPAACPEDEAYVDALEEAILEREKEAPTGFLPDVEQQWAEFQEFYLAPGEEGSLFVPEEMARASSAAPEPVPFKAPPKRRLRRVFLVAAVMAFLFVFVLPPALGYRHIGEMFGQWTDHAFRFTPDSEASESPSAPPIDGEYQSLQEALDDHGIEEKLVPTWVPDGYVLTEVSVYEYAEQRVKKIIAFYENGDHSIGIEYVYHNNSRMSIYDHEKDGTSVREYIVDGVTHYLFENLGRSCAAWYRGDIECLIQSGLSMEELETMIDSIYEG